MNETQRAILEIYKAVACVCEQLGLRHYAIGGTAIGAVRHHGFVPWDDDLDIALPIEDYERFIREASTHLPGHLKVRTFRDCRYNQNVFAKVHDIRNTNIEPHELPHPSEYKGVYIDIMPMAGIPNGASGMLFNIRLMLYGILLRTLPWDYADKHSGKAKAFWLICYPLRIFINAHSVLGKWEHQLQKHPFNSSSKVGYTWYWKPWELTFPKTWFDDFVDMPFEDVTIRMPIRFHEYLTRQFGNYMEIPPIEEQYTHNGFIDLEHSYTEYRDGCRRLPESYISQWKHD